MSFGPGPISTALKALKTASLSDKDQAQAIRDLSAYNLDFVQTVNFDRLLQVALQSNETLSDLPGLKLAVLSSSTVDHLIPSLRVAAFRRA